MVILFSIIRGLMLILAGFGIYSFFKPMFQKTGNPKEKNKIIIRNSAIALGIIIIIGLPVNASLTEKEKKNLDVKFVVNSIYGQEVIKNNPELPKKEMVKK